MDSWDSKMVLDKYIYNYTKKRNLHTTAEIFGAEADISPNTVSIDSDDGFLREWWHVFWSAYNSRTTETPEHKEVPPQNLLVPSSDSDPMFDMRPAVPLGFQPLPPRVSPWPTVMVPGMGIGSFPGRSDFPKMMPPPGFRFPTSNFNAPSGMHGNGTLTLPNRVFYSSSPSLNANQLDRHMLASSSNSYPSERAYKIPQLCLTKDDKSGSGIWRSNTAVPARYPPKPTGRIIKSPDASDSRRFKQEQLRLPIRNSNVSSRLTAVECAHKMPLLSKDDKCGVGTIKLGSSDTVPQSPVPVPGPGPATLIPVADQFRFPANKSNFNPDSSHAQKNKKREICVSRDKKCGVVEAKTEPRDISDASISEQGHFGDPQMDMYPNSQIFNVGQLSRLLSAPTKFNYPPQNAHKKKVQCCVKRDEGLFGTTSRRSAAAESTQKAPKAILQHKSEPVESGSSASSNSRSSSFGPSS